VAAGILQVDEAGKSRIRRNLHGEVDHPIKDVAKGTVHAAGRLDDSDKLSHMGNKPVDVEGLGTARDTDPRQGISRRPAVDQGTTGGRPGDARLEPVQGGLARLCGDETDAEKLGGRNHEDICNSSNVDSKVLEEKLVPHLLGDVGPNRPQVDEDGKALEIGHMMQGSGSSSRQADQLGGAATGSSYF
jgi:hypothetical protein